jgi:hypothetical protein
VRPLKTANASLLDAACYGNQQMNESLLGIVKVTKGFPVWGERSRRSSYESVSKIEKSDIT